MRWGPNQEVFGSLRRIFAMVWRSFSGRRPIISSLSETNRVPRGPVGCPSLTPIPADCERASRRSSIFLRSDPRGARFACDGARRWPTQRRSVRIGLLCAEELECVGGCWIKRLVDYLEIAQLSIEFGPALGIHLTNVLAFGGNSIDEMPVAELLP